MEPNLDSKDVEGLSNYCPNSIRRSSYLYNGFIKQIIYLYSTSSVYMGYFQVPSVEEDEASLGWGTLWRRKEG